MAKKCSVEPSDSFKKKMLTHEGKESRSKEKKEHKKGIKPSFLFGGGK